MLTTNSRLIEQRERAMDRAEIALDAAWPERLGESYVREMQAAAEQIEQLAVEMQTIGMPALEQSRTYRYLGMIYSDLAPAFGKGMLIKAKEVYQSAETLLEGNEDASERAKLDFNIGNTLRQLDPNDIEQLEEAKRRFLSASGFFSAQATQYMPQADEALLSTQRLISLARLAQESARARAEIDNLDAQLVAGGDIAAISKRMQAVNKKNQEWANQALALIQTSKENSASTEQNAKFHEIEAKIDLLISHDNEESKRREAADTSVFQLLKNKTREQVVSGEINSERARVLENLLDKIQKELGSDVNEMQFIVDQMDTLRTKASALAHLASESKKMIS